MRSKHKPKPKPVEYTLRHFAIAAVSNQALAREMIQSDRGWLARKSSGIGETKVHKGLRSLRKARS